MFVKENPDRKKKKKAYSRRFVLCGLRKAGINGYVNQVKPHISKC